MSSSEHVEPATTSPLDISDDLIFKLAGDVGTVDQLDALGIALGFKTAAMNKFHATNNLTGSVSSRGTREMLTEWRQKTPGADKTKLKRALQQAGMIELSETYFREAHLPVLAAATDEDSFDVGALRKRLMTHYKQEVCHLPLRPWDNESSLIFHRHFVDVDLYEQGQCNKSIQEAKSLNDLLQMACDKQDYHFRFAVLANAGRGKSMLVAKIAYDWSHEVKGSPLRNVELLFVITMRLLQESASLEDAILSQLLVGEEKFRIEDLRKYITDNQSKIMLVFDGCDEYTGTLLGKEIKSNIVSIIQNLKLQECPTIVTSRFRHQRSFTKASLSYVKMELNGFTSDNVRRYIKGFFHGQEASGEKLCQVLEHSPVVHQLVQIPLFCVMVCDLWQQDAFEDVQTQTGLLNQVIQFLWHHLRAKDASGDEEESSYSSDDKESAYDSDSGESQELEALLNELGQVVLDLYLDDNTRTVFSKKDFKRVPNELKKACEMGLMSQRTMKETKMKMGKKSEKTEIQFYHKLAQEHIAANYLTLLPSGKLEETLSGISDFKGIHKYENLLRFTCGFGAVSCAKVLGHLLTQLWLNQPLPPNKNATFRLALDFLNECPEVNDAVVGHLDTIFQERYLCLYAATPSAILGLKKLPQPIKNKIRMMRFQSMELSDSSCREFCEVLPAFRQLQHLGLRGVNASEASFLSIVEAARNVRTIKGVLFKYCSTSKDGTLHSFLKENDVSIGSQNMRVLLFSDDGSDGTFYCSRT